MLQPAARSDATGHFADRPTVGIIGTGIAGMGAAHRLHPHADITLFEASDWVGGHSHTVDATVDGVTVPVDTGFIVYNERTYPLLTSLFREIGVETEPSDMSFAVVGGLEYEGSLRGMFTDPRARFRPSHYAMIADIVRFNAEARRASRQGIAADVTLGEFVEGYGETFRTRYLLPMGAAIWSTSVRDMASYPAEAFIRFFANHGLLDLRDRPKWRTVTGGSRSYVRALTAPFRDRIHLDTAVEQITRSDDGVIVATSHGDTRRFDYVVAASHADTTLALLAESATPIEREVLGNFRYSTNEAVLHTDPSFMPQAYRAWASWNVSADTGNGPPSLTYWMNRLQNLDTPRPLFVTLNPTRPPAEILGAWQYDHPLFDLPALRAQPRVQELQAVDRIAYAGAFMRNGFHEDGLLGGYLAADAILRSIQEGQSPRPDSVSDTVAV